MEVKGISFVVLTALIKQQNKSLTEGEFTCGFLGWTILILHLKKVSGNYRNQEC